MIHLPTSIGEAVDKLTILDIKCKRISDPERLVFCRQEYELLYSKLDSIVSNFQFYYDKLYEVNDLIWIMQDEIRSMKSPSGEKCIEIINMNDIRFRIKDYINKLSKSQIRETKGYPKRTALFLGHQGLGDHIGLIGAIRYLSLQYDEFYVACLPENLNTVSNLYLDNPNIKLFVPPIFTSGYRYTVYPTDTLRGEYMNIPDGVYTDVFRCGLLTLPRNSLDDLPSCFYKDLGIDPSIRHSYFHLPKSADSIWLHSLLESMPYIFVQTKSSENTTSIISWDIDKTFTIDPNINQYESDHIWYSLAQKFVNQPFFHYVDTIKHASEIHTVDSSFYCLSCYLKTDAKVKLCYNRDSGEVNTHYDFS
jgi:hypothetical protein